MAFGDADPLIVTVPEVGSNSRGLLAKMAPVELILLLQSWTVSVAMGNPL
jgi:hypothetical protein